MPIRRKVTGLKRGSKGFVYRIPTSELGNLSKDEVNRNLREVYGTDQLRVYDNGKRLPFKNFLENLGRVNKLRADFPTMMSGIDGGYPLGKSSLEIHYTGRDSKLKKRFKKDWSKYLEVVNYGEYVILRPLVALHGITGQRFNFSEQRKPEKAQTLETYQDLKSILEKGFRKMGGWEGMFSDNVTTRGGKRFSRYEGNPISSFTTPSSEGITKGDSYHLEFVPEKGILFHGQYVGNVESSPPENVLGVNVVIKYKTKEEREAKMKFYKEQITRQYGVPVRFYISRDNHKAERIFPKRQALEQKLTATTALVGILGSLFFSANSLTGNAIANLSTNTTSWIGAVLLAVGLVASLFWIRSKKK